MEIKKEKCSRCGNLNYIVPSNNPLVTGICIGCLNETLDASRVEHFEFFCRTYNLPFNPTAYMNLYKKHKKAVFLEYAETLSTEGKVSFEGPTADLWKEVDQEWSRVKNYTDILLKIEPLRTSFEQRALIKWGEGYTFGELVQLENLLTNTVKAYNINDPMRLDAIKKAAKLSIKIDALIESGEAKSIKDFTAAYQSFLKAAQIDDFGAVASEGTIKTVADLYKYMEKNGFEFKFYDKEERDIVDRTIADIKKTIKEEISNATGLDIKLEEMQKAFNAGREEDKTDLALSEAPLRNILKEDYYDEVEVEADTEFGSEDLAIEYDED